MAAVLLSGLQVQLASTPTNRVSSSVLHRQGAMPALALACAVACERQDQSSHFHDLRSPATGVEGQGEVISPLPTLPYGR